jgi:phosphohistidine phosphatase SixA
MCGHRTAARAAVCAALAALLTTAPLQAGADTRCVGDCAGTGVVTISQLILGVRIALGTRAVADCPAFDPNGDGQVTIAELILAVHAALTGCGPVDTPTTAPSATPTRGESRTAPPTASATHTTAPAPTPTATAVASDTPEPASTSTPSEADTPIETVTPGTPSPIVEATDTPTATEIVPTATDTAEPESTPTATAEPSPTATLPVIPADLQADVETDQVVLRWTPPDPQSGYTSVIVLRRLNGPIEGPDDPQAIAVFAGAGGVTFDPVTELLPDVPDDTQIYYYAVYGCGDDGCEHTGSTVTFHLTLVQALRAGGYTIHWRHADADVCADRTELKPAATTDVPGWWKSCDASCDTATARQLNDAGRMHAIAIGEAFRSRGIPIGRVLSSEFCRNVTTAELMDFGPPIEQDQGITFFVYDEPNRCAVSYARIAVAPALGTNTAIIGHAGFPSICPILSSLQWSEAAVFRPDGSGDALFIARVPWDQWATLP